MSRWNRVGKASQDNRETSQGSLDLRTWLWLREAIDDVFRYDPVDDIILYGRDGSEMLPLLDLEIIDCHNNDGSITREIIFRPNKKCKGRRYIG